MPHRDDVPSEAKEADRVRTALEAEMPAIECLLAQAGTSPMDFTLHDAQQSGINNQRPLLLRERVTRAIFRGAKVDNWSELGE